MKYYFFCPTYAGIQPSISHRIPEGQPPIPSPQDKALARGPIFFRNFMGQAFILLRGIALPLKKQGLDQFASKVNYNVITIEPLKIRYLNLLKGFRNVLWEKE